MKVVSCRNGCFFDGDTYQVCPHCGAPVDNSAKKKPDDPTEQRKFSLFRKTKSGSQSSRDSQKTRGSKSSRGGSSSKGGAYTPPVTPRPNPVIHTPSAPGITSKPDPIKVTQPDLPTQDPPEKGKNGTVTIDIWNHIDEADAETAEAKENKADLPAEHKTESVQADDGQKSDTGSKQSLYDQVKNATASSDGKTMSYFSALTYKSDNAAKQDEPPRQIDPVVGWLVSIKGEHFGESFPISAGMNSIGRSESNRVVLSRDIAVSRDKHALVTYEPKHRRFYIKPGDSTGLTYLNEEYITETKQLSAKDIIEIGNSVFIFIPLCGEEFSWEDYMKG